MAHLNKRENSRGSRATAIFITAPHAPPPGRDLGLDVGERGMPGGGEVDVGDEDYQEGLHAHHGGDRKPLAERLGVSERTLYRKLAG